MYLDVVCLEGGFSQIWSLFCVWSLVIRCHTVIDKANKRISKRIIMDGIFSMKEPIEIGYLNIHASGITELQEQYSN